MVAMSETQSIHDLIEDHALQRVPDAERHGWLAMSWNTVGIVTTLVQIYVGARIGHWLLYLCVYDHQLFGHHAR